jgi:hypothetical protein
MISSMDGFSQCSNPEASTFFLASQRASSIIPTIPHLSEHSVVRSQSEVINCIYLLLRFNTIFLKPNAAQEASARRRASSGNPDGSSR